MVIADPYTSLKNSGLNNDGILTTQYKKDPSVFADIVTWAFESELGQVGIHI